MSSHIYIYQVTSKEFWLDQIPTSLYLLSIIAEHVISLWTPLTSNLFEETHAHHLSLKYCSRGHHHDNLALASSPISNKSTGCESGIYLGITHQSIHTWGNLA